MCRYGLNPPYRMHYACLACRKVFRLRHDERKFPCPECGGLMRAVGRDFKAPPRRDVKAWRLVKLLLLEDIRWHACGCDGPGPLPATLREIPEFKRRW
jgi:DNA-directed RNA polymerase subunit RPC12/RpoP